MERRVLLAVFLSFLVLFVYQAIFAPPTRPPAQPTEAPEGALPPTPEARPVESAPAQPAVPVEPQSAPAALLAAAAERGVRVETDDVEAVFSNRGGVLQSYRLKRYLDQDGVPLELVTSDVPPGTVRPFALQVPDPALTSRLAAALFKSSVEELDLSGNRDGSLTFEFADEGGLTARKIFRFAPGTQPYVIGFTAVVENAGQSLNPAVLWGPGIGSGVNTSGASYYTPPRPVLFRDGKVARLKASALASEPRYEGVFPFAGVEDHYFLVADVNGGRQVTIEYEPQPLPTASHAERTLFSFVVRYPDGPSDTRYFLGPKDFDILETVQPDLVRAIDYGIFAWLVVPLLRALKWIDGFVGNYGWSIIILTVLINVVIGPLRHKSVVSMRKMQEIQPEVKAVQERYSKLKATDPARQKMNAELMNLYRERGVNPASGCVPMLLTLPVLFAFYSLLSVAIELRGAPFVGWIHDLSAPDPLYVTPILMGVTMLIQQKMTPSAADPTQQKVMMVMPVMFTVMFLWAPSGLVLYWFMSNLCGIAQQQITNTLIGPPRVRVARPPAERRMKRVGAGKTEQAAKDEKS